MASNPEPLAVLLREADRCVMCGLCLPHCPTYGETLTEAESPRGRISLMLGLARGEIEPTPALRAHLDHCLGCRACERACPSGVPYGELIDAARTLTRREKRPLAARLGLRLVTRRPLMRGLSRLLRRYQRSGLQRLARASGILRLLELARVEGRLPPLPDSRPWRSYYPPASEERGRVGLFLGCITDPADQPTLRAAVRVLNRLGYGVHVPQAQGCCGALHQHNGDPDTALHLAAANIAAFAELPVSAVLHTASGCTAQLYEYHRLAWPTDEQRERARAFSSRVMDISSFLADAEWPADVRPSRLAARVAIHDPCSLRNVLRQQDGPYRLLARVPGLAPVALPDNQRCCGAAGSHVLTQPDLADALRARKLQAVDQAGADIVLSSNIGCALHLASGLRAAGTAVEVLHPVALLDRLLAPPP